MIPVLTGIFSGLIVILLFSILKQFDKSLVYGLILCGIGFLYVGFTWVDLQSLIINCIQAVFFLLIAYFGVKRSMYILAAGYFLHGSWDLAYKIFPDPELIPPHYDLFCLSIDFTIGLYLLVIHYNSRKKHAAFNSIPRS